MGDTPTFKVKLSYFKSGGKWYSDGEYRSTKWWLHDIHNEVRDLQKTGNLPGLFRGGDHGEFVVLINVPGHPHDHQRLIMAIPSEPIQQFIERLEE